MPATSATGSSIESRLTRGYSLIELMVVMTIAVLLASSLPFAVNRLVPFRRVGTVAERFASDIRQLQAEVLVSGSSGRIAIVSQGYGVYMGDVVQRTVRVREPTLIQLVSMSRMLEQDSLWLFPDGTTSGGRFTISDSGRIIAIDVGAATGRLQIVRRTR